MHLLALSCPRGQEVVEEERWDGLRRGARRSSQHSLIDGQSPVGQSSEGTDIDRTRSASSLFDELRDQEIVYSREDPPWSLSSAPAPSLLSEQPKDRKVSLDEIEVVWETASGMLVRVPFRDVVDPCQRGDVLGPTLAQTIRLFNSLVLSRNSNATLFITNKLAPFQVIKTIICSSSVPWTFRTSLVHLMQSLYIDTDPFTSMPQFTSIRVFEDLRRSQTRRDHHHLQHQRQQPGATAPNGMLLVLNREAFLVCLQCTDVLDGSQKSRRKVASKALMTSFSTRSES